LSHTLCELLGICHILYVNYSKKYANYSEFVTTTWNLSHTFLHHEMKLKDQVISCFQFTMGQQENYLLQKTQLNMCTFK